MTTTDHSAGLAASETNGQPAALVIDKKTKRRVAAASTIGTTIEFYDFYAYAAAAVVVFPSLFFPSNDNPTVNLLASFATFGLAFVARPLGSIVFGHFGDRVGRKATLIGSLLTMGIATILIGLLPTYDQVGIIAPALLALMRFCQGLGLGGEWSGAALLAGENAEPTHRARAAMWPQLGAPFGFFLANGFMLILVAVLAHEDGDLHGAFMTWGWRLPFLSSALMIAVGLWVRFSLEETPVFKQAVDQGKKVKSPLKELFKTSPGPVVQATLIMLSTYTLFYLVTTWILSYGIGNRSAGTGLSIPYFEFLQLQLLTIVFFAIMVPVSGWLADVWGRKNTLTLASVLLLLFGTVFNFLLDPETATKTTVFIFLMVGMSIMGLIFGPMSAILPELFPTNVRYTGSGIAYNVASILGAAIAPFIATWLVSQYSVAYVGYYLIIVTAITFVAVLTMKENKNHDLREV
ncbi:MFS transporter [Corynebacterium crudilactis]|uniref:MFS transporter n=1 Tax=Corynebacterium crudilactis TaxID=1652495 RepID=A0A172QTG1_9CORY|nr:MFS transporter [Corynebacterium crudilactis]ANE03997.1 MFS transporter [Corynebacterium crudilactis]